MFADGTGLLCVRGTKTNGENFEYKYQLPQYYERTDIQPRESAEAFDVIIPLQERASQDVMML